jgi:hypothetical protein
VSTEITKAFTARKAHDCANCRQLGEGRGTIAPGHRYLKHTAFPGNEFMQIDAPESMKECAACAIRRDWGTHVVTLAACQTYCCGTTPCALPPVPGAPAHDHSCRECAGRPDMATVASGS